VITAEEANQQSPTSINPIEPQTTDTSVENEEEMTVQMVEGFSNWRKVDRGNGMPYYFHMISQETRWEPPSMN
jgi:hypothetical protein